MCNDEISQRLSSRSRHATSILISDLTQYFQIGKVYLNFLHYWTKDLKNRESLECLLLVLLLHFWRSHTSLPSNCNLVVVSMTAPIVGGASPSEEFWVLSPNTELNEAKQLNHNSVSFVSLLKSKTVQPDLPVVPMKSVIIVKPKVPLRQTYTHCR